MPSTAKSYFKASLVSCIFLCMIITRGDGVVEEEERQGGHFQQSACMPVCSVAQSCPALRNPMDCSPPGSFVHGFSRQEYWSGLSFSGNLLNPGIEPISPALQAASLPLSHQGQFQDSLSPPAWQSWFTFSCRFMYINLSTGSILDDWSQLLSSFCCQKMDYFYFNKIRTRWPLIFAKTICFWQY